MGLHIYRLRKCLPAPLSSLWLEGHHSYSHSFALVPWPVPTGKSHFCPCIKFSSKCTSASGVSPSSLPLGVAVLPTWLSLRLQDTQDLGSEMRGSVAVQIGASGTFELPSLRQGDRVRFYSSNATALNVRIERIIHACFTRYSHRRGIFRARRRLIVRRGEHDCALSVDSRGTAEGTFAPRPDPDVLSEH